jgi:uncharacterized repeat protein (TIGR04076 family)
MIKRPDPEDRSTRPTRDGCPADAKARNFDIYTAFDEGRELVLDGMKTSERFCSWAWADIQRDIAVVSFRQGYPRVGAERTAIARCTDGSRPVPVKIEHLDVPDPARKA